jgi:hypothetical protein
MSNVINVTRHPEYTTDSLHETVRAQVVALTTFLSNRVTSVVTDLAIGTTSKADIRVNAAVDYIRDGVQRTQKAAAEVNIPSGATMANDGTVREVCVLVYINSSDAFAAVAGTVVNDGETAIVPDLPAGGVQIGYARISAAAGTAFTADSTLLDAAGITATFVDNPVPEQNWDFPLRLGNM